MKKILFFLLLTFSSLLSQTFEEYQKEQDAVLNSYKSSSDKEFKSFQEQSDKDFIAMLKGTWSFIDQERPKELYIKKKPKTVPSKKIVQPTNVPEKEKEPIVTIQNRPIVVVAPTIIKEPVKPSIKTVQPTYIADVDYFGIALHVNFFCDLPSSLKPIKKSEDFTSFWERMSQLNFAPTIKQLKTIEKTYQFNGYSTYQVVQNLSKKVYTHIHEQQLLTWFLLNKLGYKVKVGYKKEKIVLLSATDVEVFSTLYFTINKQRYYALDYYLKKDFGSLYTYKKDFPTSNKVIDFSMKILPLFPKETIVRHITFKEGNQHVDVDITLNTHLLAYLKTFPQVGYSTYFNTVMLAESDKLLVDALTPLLKNKTKTEALNVLLHFVQKAFKYQTDWDQFGYEKVMFPEETLFYGYSDCDDRAVLFAYLAERLLHVKAVGLKFSNHMATAIYYEGVKTNQDYLEKDSFIISDPTYINANVGQSMPKYLHKNATIITSTNSQSSVTQLSQKVVKK